MGCRLLAASLAACVVAQQSGTRYLDSQNPSAGIAKLPGAVDDRLVVFPIDGAQFLPGAVFDVYVEVHGVSPASTPQVELVTEGTTDAVAVTSLVPYDGRTPVFSTRAWNFTYVDPDFSRFNTTVRNGLATSREQATGFWWRRCAVNAVGTHTLRVTVDGVTKTVEWTVLAPVKRKAKNVILFIGDGLNIPFITAARIVSRGQTQGFINDRLNMEKAEHVGLMSTMGYDSIITDSANSAASYTNGHKGPVNALNVYGDSSADTLDDAKVEIITERLRRDRPNMAIGVVTTSEIQDATPASMFAHTRRRDNKAEITYQMLFGADGYPAVRPDVVMGGGGRYFNGTTTAAIPAVVGRNMWADAEAAGYRTCFERSCMKSQGLKGDKLLGIFHFGNMDTWIDRRVLTQNLSPAGWPVRYTTAEAPLYRRNVTDQPDLAEMTQSALDVLAARGDEDGFFLMVEGASIDKQEHPMDFDRAIAELIDMDNAVAIAQAYARQHKDTLVIVTSDHAQGYDAYGTVDTAAFNLPDAAAVNGSDLTKEQYAAAEATKVAAIGLYQAAGFPTYRDANSDGFPDDWRPRVTLAQSKVDHPNSYRESFQLRSRSRLPEATLPGSTSLTDDRHGLRLVGPGDVSQTGGQTAHTLADVPLYASGPGSDAVRVHNDNVDLFAMMARALGLGADVATYPATLTPAGGVVEDVTCDAVVPTFVKHATLGLLTTACPPGATTCDASQPIVVGSKTYYKVRASMESLNLREAPAEAMCAASH